MKYFFLIFFISSLSVKSQLLKKIALSSNSAVEWQFRKQGDTQWKPATTPGNIYTDLLQNKLIPDPYTGTNEKEVQWVDTCYWEYSTTFNIDKLDLKEFRHCELSLEKIDTYCKIYLNKVLIFNTDNFFKTYKKDILKLLKPGANTLSFSFEPASKKGKALAKKLSYVLPGDEKIFTRKPQYQYGWDWGPRLIGCGISGNVNLTLWKDIRITDFSFEQKFISKDSAILFSTLIIESDLKQIVSLNTNCKNHPEIKTVSKSVELKKGQNILTEIIHVLNPELWWCNGQGSPNLYFFDAELKNGSNENISSSKKIGIRKLNLIRKKDLFGESFYFELNGVPVFMKGANYIPPDNFLSKTSDSEFPALAKKCNMNMLRVWGGGTYATDDFYSQCDENGILVWQDFMFACAMYPGDKKFTENVLEEVKEQVIRLRNHPSLALWCGNNEINEGWHNWGWQKEYKYNKKDSATIWNTYLHLFEKEIPLIVKKFNSSTTYWPSSPSIGWGHQESLLSGDSHYWGVWWGMEPFENYEKKVGRFMSEYGFQGMPSLEAFKTFCDSSQLNMKSATVLAHQKHPTGYKTIETYMERDYKIPSRFDDYIYVSQLLQRDGMKTAIESHRRNKPYCMGTLFWQFNDCWPVTSWSAMDYYKKPKAFYYLLPALFNAVSLSSKTERGTHSFYIISDTLIKLEGELTIDFMTFSGEKRSIKKMNVTVEPNSSAKYFSIEDDAVVEFTPSTYYFHVTFKSGNIIREYNSFLCKPKKMNLPKPELIFNLNQEKNKLTVTSKVFVKDFYLRTKQPGIKIEPNFIDLEPGRTYTFNLNGNLNSLNDLIHISLYDINSKSN